VNASGADRRLVTFGLGDAWYAADIARVERVLRYEHVHPVPNMPPWMRGVIEHLGRVIPVIDLRTRFALNRRAGPHGAEAPAGGARLLVLSLGDELVAAAVDRVIDVRAVSSDDVAPPPRLVRGAAGEFLLGMMRRDGQVVLLLDVARLLSPDDHRALDDCLPADIEPSAASAATASYDA